MNTPFRIFALIFTVTAIVLSGCASNPRIPPIEPVSVPDSTVSGDHYAEIKRHFDSQRWHRIASGSEFEKTERVFLRLVAASGAEDPTSVPWLLVDAPEGEINALVYKGSTVVVFDEMVKAVQSDDELAAVLAHELAHISRRHHEDATEEKRRSGVSVFGTLLGVAAGVALGGDGGFSSSAADLVSSSASLIGEGAVVKSYSRKLEHEADALGMNLMRQAGYDPGAAVDFWSRADQIFGGKGGGFLSTHPSNSRRLQQLKRVQEELDVSETL